MTPVTLDGTSVLPWLWRPNGRVLERLEWLTDVLEAFKGAEQRIQLRGSPRRFFEFAIALQDDARRQAESALFSGSGGLWAVPVWMDGTRLQVSAAAGVSMLSAVTGSDDFHIAGHALLLQPDGQYEVVTISDLDTGVVSLSAPLVNSFSGGLCRLYPLRIARLADATSFSRFTGQASTATLRWQCVDQSVTAAADLVSSYRDLPVLTIAPNWVGDIQHDLLRKREVVDNGLASPFFDEAATVPGYLQSHRWTLDGRAAIHAFRQMLYARRGRLAWFWLPTFAQDLRLVASVGAMATSIDVAHCNYTDQVAQGVGRRDLRIKLRTGAILYRRITASAVISGTTERLTLDAALGLAVTPTDIAAISFMALSRFDADAVELSWIRSDLVESAMNIRSVRNDL